MSTEERKRKLVAEAEARGHKLTEFRYIPSDGYEAAYCETCRRSVLFGEGVAHGNCLKFDCFEKPVIYTPAQVFYAGLTSLMDHHGIDRDLCYRKSECAENHCRCSVENTGCQYARAMPFRKLEQEFRVSVVTLEDLRGLLRAVGGYDHDSWYAFETLRLYAQENGIDLDNMPVRKETPLIAA